MSESKITDKDILEYIQNTDKTIPKSADDFKHMKEEAEKWVEQGRSNRKSVLHVWRLTSLGAGIVFVVDLILIYVWLSTNFILTGFLITIGLVTLLGMLIVSSYHSERHPKHIQGSTGVMRRALTVSFVVVYFVVFSVIVFGEPTNTDDQNLIQSTTLEKSNSQIFSLDYVMVAEEETLSKETEHEETLDSIKVKREVVLDHLTKIMITILGFYFGTKGVKEIVEAAKKKPDTITPEEGKKTDEAGKKKPENNTTASHDGHSHD